MFLLQAGRTPSQRCGCRAKQQHANASNTVEDSERPMSTFEMKKYGHSLGLYSNLSDSSDSSTSDEKGVAKAVKIYSPERYQNCCT